MWSRSRAAIISGHLRFSHTMAAPAAAVAASSASSISSSSSSSLLSAGTGTGSALAAPCSSLSAGSSSFDGKSNVIVVGAGLAGSLLAIHLAANKRLHVRVFERRGDMRLEKISAGRSINLALSTRGKDALAEVGLLDDVMQLVLPMKGRMMHATDCKLTFQSYSKDGQSCINSVSRGELNKRLMTLAEAAGVKIEFNKKVDRVDTRSGALHCKDGEIIKNAVVFGADGAFSKVRDSMMSVPFFDFSQEYSTAGYKELHMPPTPDGKHRMDNDCLHIWPRGKYMMIALPNQDGSFTCTLFFPRLSGEEFDVSFDSLKTKDQVSTFFETQFPDVIPLMPTLLDDYFANPMGALVTIRCYPWSVGDKVCLVGDAAHAVVPFFGQGMNAAFESVSILNQCILKHTDGEGVVDWARAFTAYGSQRKNDTDAIATMAAENYIEMRDKVADVVFLFRKKVMAALGNRFPDRVLSRYELVSFTRSPYSYAFQQGLAQDQMLDELLTGVPIGDLDKVDMTKAEVLIDKYLGPLNKKKASL